MLMINAIIVEAAFDAKYYEFRRSNLILIAHRSCRCLVAYLACLRELQAML